MSERYINGRGKSAAWIYAHVSYAGDDCLIWPFSTNGTGYGRVGINGSIYYAHRVMCELAHGEPPTPAHEAAHACGNGMKSCINPRHLEWKTPSANQLDRRRHGTAVTSPWGNKGKLTRVEKEQIIALKGQKPQREIAGMFGCHFQTVSRLHKEGIKTEYKYHVMQDDEIATMRSLVNDGCSPKEIALRMGLKPNTIYRKIERVKRSAVPL